MAGVIGEGRGAREVRKNEGEWGEETGNACHKNPNRSAFAGKRKLTNWLISDSKGGFPLSRNFYVRTDVYFNWLYVRKLK